MGKGKVYLTKLYFDNVLSSWYKMAVKKSKHTRCVCESETCKEHKPKSYLLGKWPIAKYICAHAVPHHGNHPFNSLHLIWFISTWSISDEQNWVLEHYWTSKKTSSIARLTACLKRHHDFIIWKSFPDKCLWPWWIWVLFKQVHAVGPQITSAPRSHMLM